MAGISGKGADLCSTLGGRTDNLDCGLQGAAKALEVSRCGRGLIQWRRNEFESRGHRSGAKVGAPIRREAPEFFLVVPLHFVGPKSIISSRFGECFRDGQYSLVVFCWLFFYSWCPLCQTFVKVGGGTCPYALWSRRHWAHPLQPINVTVSKKH